jgi:hypothetical protein
MSWSVNKREFLAGSAAGAVWALAGRSLGRGTDATLFDERIAAALVDERTPLGRDLAREVRRAGLRTISLDAGNEAMWRDSRRGFGLRSGEAMIGLTSWSDWTLLRPALADHRKLAHAELRIDRADMPAGELVRALGESLPGQSITRLRFGGMRSARTQFAWLVA